jgi:hypothetical protein
VKLFADEDMAIMGDYTQWEWNVIPLKSGMHRLNLCVDAIIEMPNLPERVKHLSVLEREVNVKVNPRYQIRSFVRSYWQYVITTIIALVVAIVAIFTYFKKELV